MPVPKITLNDGNKIPVVAFGTGTALYNKECAELVCDALKTGYTSLDGAQIYANSQSIGDALKQWGGKREDVFVLTKCECAAAEQPGGEDGRRGGVASPGSTGSPGPSLIPAGFSPGLWPALADRPGPSPMQIRGSSGSLARR